MRRLILYVLLLALLGGCAAPVDPDTARESIQVLAMDTAMLITTYGERSVPAAYACEDTIRDLEAQFSRTDPDSAVSRLNNAGGESVEVEEDLGRLILIANTYHQWTNGALDISIAPVASAWGFTEDSFRVPSQEELEELLRLKGRPQFSTPGIVTSVSLSPGQSIDLGAIAKGYAADKILEVLQEYEVPRANISLGGNVLAYGGRPDGTPWRVGIQTPGDLVGTYCGAVLVENASVVTSGIYERGFDRDATRYHHILDPRTGMPSQSDLAAVTLITPCSTDGDAWTTACLCMGSQWARDFCSALADTRALFLLRTGELQWYGPKEQFIPL